MSPQDFILAYENALHTQRWERVMPLIHPNAGITFTNGTVLQGINEIKPAYEKNFAYFKNEEYKIENVRWLIENENTASYLFDFSWKCIIDNKVEEGSGIGSATIVYEKGSWLIISEHLGKKF